MSDKLYLTLIEVANPECPNIGTISGYSEESLYKKAVEALESHFDINLVSIKIQDNLGFMDAKNSPPLDADAEFSDGSISSIEIQQTFLY